MSNPPPRTQFEVVWEALEGPAVDHYKLPHPEEAKKQMSDWRSTPAACKYPPDSKAPKPPPPPDENATQSTPKVAFTKCQMAVIRAAIGQCIYQGKREGRRDQIETYTAFLLTTAAIAAGPITAAAGATAQVVGIVSGSTGAATAANTVFGNTKNLIGTPPQVKISDLENNAKSFISYHRTEFASYTPNVHGYEDAYRELYAHLYNATLVGCPAHTRPAAVWDDVW